MGRPRYTHVVCQAFFLETLRLTRGIPHLLSHFTDEKWEVGQRRRGRVRGGPGGGEPLVQLG